MIHTTFYPYKNRIALEKMDNIPTVPKLPMIMNAVQYHLAIGPAGLGYERIHTPEVGADDVLVRVHAAAITRDELEWPVNRLPAIPSYEFSGVVAALGRNVRGLAIGAPVFGLSAFDRDGAAAEYILTSPAFLARKPASLDHIQSAALPLSGLTAWQGLFEYGQLSADQRVLIHGAAGGVGSLAVQLARYRGAHVIGTVSSAHVQRARELGVDEVIDHTKTRFEEFSGQVDLVFDTFGGELLERSAGVLGTGARLVSVASEPSQQLAAARGYQASYFVVRPDGKQLGEIAKLVDEGLLHPLVDKVYSLTTARQAFERSLAPHPAGKIVLRINEEHPAI